MLVDGAIFGAGLLSWSFVEYAVHGWMGHLYQTFVTRLHAVHHRDPNAVFAIKSWLPTAAVLTLLLVSFGWASGVVFYCGLLAGFVMYEVVHYRIHFAFALTPWEARLRSHHLVHHLRRPQMCLGVTTSFWDRVFGTEPSPTEATALYASVKDVPPLSGPSNIHKLFSGGY